MLSTFLLLLTVLAGPCKLAHTAQPPWWSVSDNRSQNVSGMALITSSENEVSFVVVHDNRKRDDEKAGNILPRAGILTVFRTKAPQYRSLVWRGSDPPEDLEAIAAVPNVPYTFVALSSRGKIYHLRVHEMEVQVIGTSELPMISANDDFEGFALHPVGNSFMAVWGERGEGKLATLFWSSMQLSACSFDEEKVSKYQFQLTVPDASPQFVRSISDVKVDPLGEVLVSASFDQSNNGPFASAIYRVGRFTFESKVEFSFEPKLLFEVKDRKVEALEFLRVGTNNFFFGTDDENCGAAIYAGWSGT